MQTTWNRRMSIVGVVLIGFVAVVVATAPAHAAGAERETGVTFTKDIAPILQRSCETCHRPKGGGPMSLISYEDVRPWRARSRTARRQGKCRRGSSTGTSGSSDTRTIPRSAMKRSRRSPPGWTTEPLAAIRKTCRSPRQWPDGGWTYGTPDLIVSSAPGIVEADAADWFGEWGNTPTGLTKDRYVKAMEVREVRISEGKAEDPVGDDSGRADLDLFVIHHAVIMAATQEQVIGANGPVSASDDALWITWELGQNATIFPDEVGVTLPANSVVTFNSMHLHSIGKEVEARVDVGFTLHPEGYHRSTSSGQVVCVAQRITTTSSMFHPTTTTSCATASTD